MLDGSADADSDVEIRGDNLASLTDLHVIGDKTSIDSGTRSTNSTVSAAESISELVEHLEVLAVLQASAAAHNELGIAEISSIGLADDVLLPGTLDVLSDGSDALNGVTIASFSLHSLLEVGGSHGKELDGVGRRDSGDCVSSVNGSLELCAAIDDLNNVRDGLDVEESAKTRHDILTETRRG